MTALEQLIRDHVLLGKESSKGFHPLKCPLCNDYKERAGFKFSENSVGYHCFNCSAKLIYNDGDIELSHKFAKLLKELDVPNFELVLGASWIKKQSEPSVITIETLKVKTTATPEIKLPTGSVLLGKVGLEYVQKQAIQYLENRKINPTSYPFYVNGADWLKNRIIIPCYRNRKLIYWQARSFVNATPRYLSCSAVKDAVMFNMDELNRWSSLPLFITEGIFDALHVNGVALLGSTLTEPKLELLKKSKRRLIFVIDQNRNGKLLGEEALDNNWEITFPPGNKTDINSAIQQYGRLFTTYTLMNNAASGFDAHVQLNIKCT
ncbi:MAG: hypothetical protein QXN55_01635 [Candidatus Nitrosotenuis sp.]